MIKNLIEEFVNLLYGIKNYPKKLKKLGAKKQTAISHWKQMDFLKKVEKIRFTDDKKKVLQSLRNYHYLEHLAKKTKIRKKYVNDYLKDFKRAGLVSLKENKSFWLTYEGRKYLKFKTANKLH